MPEAIEADGAGDGGSRGGLTVPLVMAALLLALVFAGSALGARRTEEGVKEAAAARKVDEPAGEPAQPPPDDEVAQAPGPPKAKPVPAGAALTGPTPCPAADGSSPRTDSFAQEPPQCIDPAKTYTAQLDTTVGRVVMKLDGPSRKAVNSFVVLARYHYFDGSALFQTIPELGVLVGGSPRSQSAADTGPGYTVSDPPADVVTDPATGQPKGTYTYKEGTVGLVPVGAPFSGQGAFFIGATPAVSGLDRDGVYLVLGQVTSGLDLVKRVMSTHVPCNPSDTECAGGGPDPAVVVTSVTIQET